MSLDFLEPNQISNVIIELNLSSISCIGEYFSQLEDLGCFDITIVFYEEIKENQFFKIFEQIPSNRIKSVEIISKWHDKINNSFFLRLNNFSIQITMLTFFSAPYNKVDGRNKDIVFDRQFTSNSINDFSHCGKVERKYFNLNITKFLEAVNHNSCLHKKISIDIEGNIRNCPSMPQKFGNIKDTSLEDALNHEDFKKYWNITKDEIEVCKDCEFRYICTDCRAYTEKTHENCDGLDISKPLKCGYNPYNGEWEEWNENPLKHKAIQFYKF